MATALCIIFCVYNMMLNDIEMRPNKQNWASSERSLLQTLGVNEVWLFQGVGNINIFLSLFIQRIKDTFVQNWNDRLSNSSRARTYSLFSNFSYKIYLDCLSVEKNRYALSKIRMSSHRLEIEAGRWHRPQSIP